MDEQKEGDVRVVDSIDEVYHQKFISGEWVPHRLDGPAIILRRKRFSDIVLATESNSPEIEVSEFEMYCIDGKALSREEFVCLTSKLGKILYE